MARTATWRDQRERRFTLDRSDLGSVLTIIEDQLPRLSYIPGTTRSLLVTTYLDSQHKDYLGLIERTSGHLSLKVRVREYVAIFESAGEPPRLAASTTCFLERKERTGELRVKQRIELPKRDVARVLRGETALSGDRGVVAAIRGELDARELSPVLVSAYRRRVYGSDSGLRVTIDDEIGFHPPRDDLYEKTAALTPDVLGEPIGSGPEHILEVKEPTGHDTPGWLEALLERLTPAEQFSKFREGMRALKSWAGVPRRQARATSG